MTLNYDPRWPRAGDWRPVHHDRRADIAVLGVPTSGRSLSPTRAHLTPAAVRAALRRYSLDVDLDIVDAGDLPHPDADLDASTAAIADLDAGLVIALGGDNSATVPVALGRAARGLVTVDAHHDLRDGHSNGSPVRQLVEAGISGDRIVQLGIEPFANSRFYAQRARDLGITVVTRDELRGVDIAAAMTQAIDRAGRGGGAVHVDLDVDVCDRAVAPGCPASAPGGLSADDLRRAARAAGAHPQVTSIDLVEVDAAADSADERTVRLVALCVLEAIAGRASL